MPLRPPEQVMGIERLAASWANALSFSRSFMRKLVRERWVVEKVRLELDGEGRGEALYRLLAGEWSCWFFAVSNVFPQDQKVDRSFGVNWDVSAGLCQGAWTEEREAILRREIPLQYSGRYDRDTLVFARGNRSERIFDYVVDSLSEGRQPDPTILAGVGYIFRTTAFAGNGLFGMRPFEGLEPGHPLSGSYHIQMATAFLLREFVFDLVDHLAKARNPTGAAPLDRTLKRYLGIGNSAGLGLVPFAAQHPQIVHRWCVVREEALAAAKSRPMTKDTVARFAALLDKAILYFEQDPRDGNGIFAPYELVARELDKVRRRLGEWPPSGRNFADLCMALHGAHHPETLELVNTILLELFPDIIEAAEGQSNTVERFDVRPQMRLAQLRAILNHSYAWHLPSPDELDEAAAFFWYYPVEAPDEPRRGLRGKAPFYEFESRMDLPLRLRGLADRLSEAHPEGTVADLLAAHPELRAVVTRIQSLEEHPYAELRDNYIARRFTPFASGRFILTFYGMEKLDPRPPRSIKGAFLQGAPLAEDVARGEEGEWPFPLVPLLAEVRRDEAPLEGRPLRAVETPDPLPRKLTRLLGAGGSERSDRVEIFPVELRKLITKALLAKAVPLGAADEAASIVEFALAFDPAALSRFIGAIQAAERFGPLARRVQPGELRLNARDDPACLHLPTILDLATADVLHSGSRGITARLDARQGAHLAGFAAYRAALRRLIALVSWREGDNSGAFAAGPDGGGAWLAILPRGGATMDAAEAEHLAAPAFDGIAVRLFRPGKVGAAIRDELARGARDDYDSRLAFLNRGELDSRLRRIYEIGTTLSPLDFDALLALAKRTLVPEDVEPRIIAPAPPRP